jgi:hypothetical protein
MMNPRRRCENNCGAPCGTLVGYGITAGFLLLLMAAPLMAAPNAPANVEPRFSAPVDVRIVGYVNGAPEEVRPQRTWYLNDGEEKFKLEIENLFILEGGVLLESVEDALLPHKNELMLKGDEANLKRFRTLQPKERVTLLATLDLAGRPTFRLTSVEPAATSSSEK